MEGRRYYDVERQLTETFPLSNIQRLREVMSVVDSAPPILYFAEVFWPGVMNSIPVSTSEFYYGCKFVVTELEKKLKELHPIVENPIAFPQTGKNKTHSTVNFGQNIQTPLIVFASTIKLSKNVYFSRCKFLHDFHLILSDKLSDYGKKKSHNDKQFS